MHRIDFGYFMEPAKETRRPRVRPCFGYLIFHPDGVVVVDTGIGSHPEVDAYYRPRRRPLGEALASAGASVSDVSHVVNCHLHFDHCGGNPELAGRPIFTQRVELQAARTPEYTLAELVDAPGLTYELLEGESEILSHVFVVPTPGHTEGHQSVVVRRGDGTVIIAGQSHKTATSFGRDVLAARAMRDRHAENLAPVRGWIERLLAFDPKRVVFAHDGAVWEP